MELNALVRVLNQDNRMLKRIISNLKRALRESKRTYRVNRKWSKELKNTIIQLRDIQEKDFSEITAILNLNQKEVRNLYSSAKSQRDKVKQ